MDADPFLRVTTQAIGAAGVQHVAAELLRHGLVPAFPLLDNGYDLISDHIGRISRLQIKTRNTPNRHYVTEKSCRFPILRNKAGLSTAAGYHARPVVRYTPDQFDAMVFVDFVYRRTFVVPSVYIDFTKNSLTFRNDSEWRDAWWLLKNNDGMRAARRAAKRRPR